MEQLTATKKALAKAENRALAAERTQKGLNDGMWDLRKQVEKLRDAHDEGQIAFRNHVRTADGSTSKLNKLWLRVEDMGRREREREMLARNPMGSGVQQYQRY